MQARSKSPQDEQIKDLARGVIRRGMPSERIEDTAGRLLAFWYAECELAEDKHKLEDACQRLWMGILGLNKISVATPSATHFSVASGNEMSAASRYIEKAIGVRALEDWKW